MKDRKSLILGQRPQKKKNDGKVRLIFTHNASNPPIHKWVREAKTLLVRSDQAKAIGNNIQITSRQPRNLQRMVTGVREGGHQAPPPDAGCHKCKKCKVSCPVLLEGNTFTSTNTGKKYKINKRLDCKSDHVIYLVTCAKCRGQYVGKTGLENCEVYWQNQLRCYVENGGGGCCYRKEKIKPTTNKKH